MIDQHAPLNRLIGPAAPASYRFPLGRYQATIVSDGILRWSPYMPALAANASAVDVAAELERHFLSTKTVTLDCNHLVLDDGTQRILVDAGNGPTRGPLTGHLVTNLAGAGYHVTDIDAVIITHAHPDHAWGLLDASDQLAFPNARFYVHEEEWAFWMAPEVSLPGFRMPTSVAATIIAGARRAMRPIAKSVSFFRNGDVLFPGVTAVQVPGHTVGHSALVIESGDTQLLCAADTAQHYVTGLGRPEWQPAYDADPVRAAASRVTLLGRAADERVLTLGFHFPFPGLGHVIREAHGFRWEPIPWGWTT